MNFSKPAVLRVWLPTAAIVLLMLWVTGTFHCGTIKGVPRAEPEPATSGLKTATVTTQSLPSMTEATGTVRAEQVATLTARVVAHIVEMNVSAGRRVARGEALVVLDDRDLRRRVEQARDAVSAAQATLAQARSDYRRDGPLFEQKVIPPYEFERTETNLATAEANLHRLEQAQQEAEVSLSYAVIRSPFAGVIVDRLANVGDLASPGKPLFTIYEQGRLWLEAAVPEEALANLRPGQPMSVRVDACNREIRGPIAEIVPTSDPATRTVAVRVRLEDARDVVPGMFGRLLIQGAPDRILTVPASAVIRSGQLTMVDVLESGREGRRSVQVGRTIGDQLEVYSGLNAGDVVVVRGVGVAGPEKVTP